MHDPSTGESAGPPANTASSVGNIYAAYVPIESFRYPEGVRLAVNFTVDFDAMLNRRLKREPAMELTQGEFGGRVGIWRILDLFNSHGLKLTIFTPGRICELYPEAVRSAASWGHEIANHTWEHRVPSDEQSELDHLRKATQAIERLCGKRPSGTRSGHRISTLADEGYIYTSTNAADDVPYYVFDEGRRHRLLNLPLHYVLDDAMYFHFSWFSSPNAGQRLADPETVYRIWHSAFRSLYRMGRYMNICLHPFVSGRSMRICMLERLILEMKKMPGVRIETCEETARYCLERFPPGG